MSWMKESRVNKLMEDENYRNFVVSRLNRNMDQKVPEDAVHVEDVVSTYTRQGWNLSPVSRNSVFFLQTSFSLHSKEGFLLGRFCKHLIVRKKKFSFFPKARFHPLLKYHSLFL